MHHALRAPFIVVGALLALALTVDIIAGNTLWRNYTLVGIAVYVMLLAAVVRLDWRPPRMALWLAGVTAGLHYVGGSLSGVHDAFGVNGMYYVLPWWDNVAHALGAAAVAVVAAAALTARLPTASRVLVAFLAVTVASFVGVIVELYEFVGFWWFDTVDQGFYTNTVLDLYDNVLGAAAGAFGYARFGDRDVTPPDGQSAAERLARG